MIALFGAYLSAAFVMRSSPGALRQLRCLMRYFIVPGLVKSLLVEFASLTTHRLADTSGRARLRFGVNWLRNCWGGRVSREMYPTHLVCGFEGWLKQTWSCDLACIWFPGHGSAATCAAECFSPRFLGWSWLVVGLDKKPTVDWKFALFDRRMDVRWESGNVELGVYLVYVICG